MKPLIMYFFPTSYDYILLQPKCSPQQFLLKYPHPVFSLNFRNQVSHTYKTTRQWTLFNFIFLQKINRFVVGWGLALSLHLVIGGRLLASSASGAVTLLTCSEDGLNNRSLGMPCSDCTRSRDNFVASLSITLYISRRRDREGALISAVVWVETQVITFQSACPQ